MIDEKKIVRVTNRDNGHVGYRIPDMNNLVRDFSANETKNITVEELKKLAYISGGPTLIRDYLVIEDPEVVEEILGDVEPEYYYNEEDVKKLLLNGSLDELKDCIEFAPKGTVDLVKQLAVELPVNDITKRKAILDMTGFNVDAAIMINEETKDEMEDTQRVRRVNEPVKEEVKSTGRRTAAPTVSESKYKILDK
jgi:hypothetical protein